MDKIFSKILFAIIIILLCLGILSAIMRVFEAKRQAGQEGHRGIKIEKEMAERKIQDYWSITKIEETKEEDEENIEIIDESDSEVEKITKEEDKDNVKIIDETEKKNRCLITGCSGEICADEEMMSACLWKSEYICYRDAICARNQEGVCAWQETPELLSCLASFR
ncbi:MAG TPA: hypothetical protein ENN31_01810 [Candidatus Vogelbacteria bacterium]|nr:hypothetical protein [Candidatus Vogelbacteria bacterium]